MLTQRQHPEGAQSAVPARAVVSHEACRDASQRGGQPIDPLGRSHGLPYASGSSCIGCQSLMQWMLSHDAVALL